MSPGVPTDKYVPLPPELPPAPRKKSHDDVADFAVEERAPRKHKPKVHQQARPFDEDVYESVEIPSSLRKGGSRFSDDGRETDVLTRRPRPTPDHLDDALHAANHNYQAAVAERKRRDTDVEQITRNFSSVVVHEQEARTQAKLDAARARVRAQKLEEELAQERRKAQIERREREIAERERRYRQQRERERRTVVLQGPRPGHVTHHSDPGADALERARRDYQQRTLSDSHNSARGDRRGDRWK